MRVKFLLLKIINLNKYKKGAEIGWVHRCADLILWTGIQQEGDIKGVSWRT